MGKSNKYLTEVLVYQVENALCCINMNRNKIEICNNMP